MLKKKLESHFRRLLILLPLILTIIILFIIIELSEMYDERYYNTVFKESEYIVDMVAETVEEMRREGFEYEHQKELYDTTIGGFLQQLDRKNGINVKIVDLEFNIIYEGEKISRLYSRSIFNEKSKGYDNLVSTMKKSTRGESIIHNDDGVEFQMYWRTIPAPPEQKYYVVVTVDKELVLRNNNSTGFLVGIYILCFISIVSVWDSVYVRMDKGTTEELRRTQ